MKNSTNVIQLDFQNIISCELLFCEFEFSYNEKKYKLPLFIKGDNAKFLQKFVEKLKQELILFFGNNFVNLNFQQKVIFRNQPNSIFSEQRYKNDEFTRSIVFYLIPDEGYEDLSKLQNSWIARKERGQDISRAFPPSVFKIYPTFRTTDKIEYFPPIIWGLMPDEITLLSFDQYINNDY